MSNTKDAWSTDPARREMSAIRAQLKTAMTVAVGSIALAVISIAMALFAQFSGGRQSSVVSQMTRKGASGPFPDIKCQTITLENENGDYTTMGPGGIFNVGRDGKKRWLLINAGDGPSLKFWDTAGNIRLIAGVAETTNKTTGDNTSTSPATLTLFKPNGDVIYQAP